MDNKPAILEFLDEAGRNIVNAVDLLEAEETAPELLIGGLYDVLDGIDAAFAYLAD